jgi:hypothetical protein
MRSERDIDKTIRQLRVKASDSLDERIHDDLDIALAEMQTDETPKTGRKTMIAPFTKLAAAAAVVFAVLLGLNFIEMPSTNSVAWARIPDRVAGVETFVFDLTIRVGASESGEAAEAHTARWAFYVSEEYGFRMDIYGDGNVVSWYVPPEGDTLTTVIPAEKTWFSAPIPAEQRGKMPEEYKDPADYVRRFLERPYRELGRTVIDGIEVEGVEVSDPPTDGEKLQNAVGRMWVDVQTELPVRIQIVGTAGANAVEWQMDFRWAEDVDPAVFEPNITPEYTRALQ